MSLIFSSRSNQENFGKQYVRDRLEPLDKDKTYPSPEIPSEVVKNMLTKYAKIFMRLTSCEPELSERKHQKKLKKIPVKGTVFCFK